MKALITFLILFLICVDTHASVQQQVESAIRQFAKINMPVSDSQSIQLDVNRIDPRLNLKPCDGQPSVSLPSGDWFDSKLTLAVKCQHGSLWKLYIPVKISRTADVVVASKRILKGKTIGPEDISFTKMKLDKIQHRYIGQVEKILGMVARKSISAGTPIHSRLIEQPVVVKRGQQVYISGKLPGISIRMAGKAMADGSRGETIQVQNLSSHRIIHAVVIDPGTVEVRL